VNGLKPVPIDGRLSGYNRSFLYIRAVYYFFKTIDSIKDTGTNTDKPPITYYRGSFVIPAPYPSPEKLVSFVL
jgi:hypothetical protein